MKTVRQIIQELIVQNAAQKGTFSATHCEWYLNSILKFLAEEGLADCFVNEAIHIPYEEYRKKSLGVSPYVSSPEKIREMELEFRASQEYQDLKNLIIPEPIARDSDAPLTNYHFLLKASMVCAALSLVCLIATLALAILTTSTMGIVLVATPAVASAVASYGFFKLYKMHQPPSEPPAGHEFEMTD